MNLKIYTSNIKKILLTILIAIAIFLYAESRGIDYIEQFLFILFGGINRYQNNFYLDWLILTIPSYLYLHFYGNILGDDIKRAAMLLFVRRSKRIKWYTEAICALFIYTILYFFTLILIITICFTLKGIPIYSVESYSYTISIIFSNCVLCNFTFLLGTNVLSIKMKDTVLLNFLVFIAYYPMQILLSSSFFTSNPLIKFYPAMQSALFLHQLSNMSYIGSQYFEMSLGGFSLYFSFLYNLILLLLIYLFGMIMVIKQDIL